MDILAELSGYPLTELCLVSLPNTMKLSPVSDYTYLARFTAKENKSSSNKIAIELLTDIDGNLLEEEIPEIPQITKWNLAKSQIVSTLPKIPVWQTRFYNFNNSLANSFVIKSNEDNPLAKTANYPLGSGIQGNFINNIAMIALFSKEGYEPQVINCYHPLIIQDQSHWNNLIYASVNTNTYLDKLLTVCRPISNLDIAAIETFINSDDLIPLLILWNMVLARIDKSLTYLQLRDILVSYVYYYLTTDNLFDSKFKYAIQQLPVNDIVKFLGFDSILSQNYDLPCISFDLSQAKGFSAEGSLY